MLFALGMNCILCRIFVAFLILLCFVSCKRAVVTIPTTLRTSVFSVHGINYEVTVLTTIESTMEGEGIYDYSSDHLEFEEKHGDLIVNGKQFGRVKAGDTVKIDPNGAVLINGTLQTPK